MVVKTCKMARYEDATSAYVIIISRVCYDWLNVEICSSLSAYLNICQFDRLILLSGAFSQQLRMTLIKKKTKKNVLQTAVSYVDCQFMIKIVDLQDCLRMSYVVIPPTGSAAFQQEGTVLTKDSVTDKA